MNQDSASPPPADSSQPENTSPVQNAATPSPQKVGKKGKLRRFAIRVAAFFGAFVLFFLVLVAMAGWYTSRPKFCRSCHIMEPYYDSWAVSKHKDVSCIECHFAPGIGG